MNNETAKLLEQLASKLGTTSEYLWGILLKQAPISSSFHLVGFFLSIIGAFILYRAHKNFLIDDNRFSYDNSNDLGILMSIAAFVTAAVIIGYTVHLPLIISGFYNPEYWALNYIFERISE